jgi:hypothetical protein
MKKAKDGGFLLLFPFVVLIASCASLVAAASSTRTDVVTTHQRCVVGGLSVLTSDRLLTFVERKALEAWQPRVLPLPFAEGRATAAAAGADGSFTAITTFAAASFNETAFSRTLETSFLSCLLNDVAFVPETNVRLHHHHEGKLVGVRSRELMS